VELPGALPAEALLAVGIPPRTEILATLAGSGRRRGGRARLETPGVTLFGKYHPGHPAGTVHWRSGTPRWSGPSAASTTWATPTPTTSAGSSGSSYSTSSAMSLIRPRFPVGWPPRPGGNASGPARRGARKRPGMRRRLPIALQTNRPARRSRSCCSPSGTRRCARRWRTSPVLPAADRPAHRDPPVPDAEISARLGIPSRASGPTAVAALTSWAITRQSLR
jgi:hypothetical protein